jgi:hypothetical protein
LWWISFFCDSSSTTWPLITFFIWDPIHEVFFLVSGASLERNFVLLLIAHHAMLLKFTCTREIGQRKVEKRKNK